MITHKEHTVLEGYNILIAEDNTLNQKIATILLQRQGAIVTTVANGEEAISQLQEGNYDIILMDLQMPHMDGFEATLHIRTVLNNDIPIVALSASNFDYDRQRCIAVGMNDCISKPINIAELEEIISDIFKNKNIITE